MSAPLLLADIGNTNVKLSLASSSKVKENLVVPTREYTLDALGLVLCNACSFFGIRPDEIQACVIASVVPHLDSMFTAAGKRFLGCPVFFVPDDITLPLENRCICPQEVGADRLVAAYAARQMFTERTLIVVDFGTATTFDCVQDNAYLGGLICPGILSSLQALATKTSKLPHIHLECVGPQLEIGRDTFTNINQGMIHGFAAMLEGLAQRLTTSLDDDKALVIVTGGLADRIAPVCSAIDHIRQDLLMQGLRMAYSEYSTNNLI